MLFHSIRTCEAIRECVHRDDCFVVFRRLVQGWEHCTSLSRYSPRQDCFKLQACLCRFQQSSPTVATILVMLRWRSCTNAFRQTTLGPWQHCVCKDFTSANTFLIFDRHQVGQRQFHPRTQRTSTKRTLFHPFPTSSLIWHGTGSHDYVHRSNEKRNRKIFVKTRLTTPWGRKCVNRDQRVRQEDQYPNTIYIVTTWRLRSFTELRER